MVYERKITRFKWEKVGGTLYETHVYFVDFEICVGSLRSNYGGKNDCHRLSTVDSGSLLISEVQATDAGKYECSAQSMAGSRTAPPVTLKVLAPPTVLRGPQDTEVIEGDGLDLPCEVSFKSKQSFVSDLFLLSLHRLKLENEIGFQPLFFQFKFS